MEKAIKRYWPVFVLPTLLAFIIGFVWPFLQGLYLFFQMGEAFHGLHEQSAVTVAAPGLALQTVETLQHLLAFALQRGKALHAFHKQDAVGRSGHAAGGGVCRGGQGLHLLFQMGETLHGLHEQGGVAVAVPGPAFQGAQATVELAAALFQAADALQAFRQQAGFLPPEFRHLLFLPGKVSGVFQLDLHLLRDGWGEPLALPVKGGKIPVAYLGAAEKVGKTGASGTTLDIGDAELTHEIVRLCDKIAIRNRF